MPDCASATAILKCPLSSLTRSSSRIAWSGGEIKTNKDEALSRFLERKGDAVDPMLLQSALVQSAALAAVRVDRAAAQPAPAPQPQPQAQRRPQQQVSSGGAGGPLSKAAAKNAKRSKKRAAAAAAAADGRL